jgi:hypothetical protein
VNSPSFICKKNQGHHGSVNGGVKVRRVAE